MLGPLHRRNRRFKDRFPDPMAEADAALSAANRKGDTCMILINEEARDDLWPLYVSSHLCRCSQLHYSVSATGNVIVPFLQHDGVS